MSEVASARVLGRRGGLARARRLSAIDRRRIAALGAHARIRSLQTVRRIVANFRYAQAAQALRGGHPPVTRVRGFAGPLPGVYRERP